MLFGCILVQHSGSEQAFVEIVFVSLLVEGVACGAQECRELVRQYVPEIMKAVVSLPEEQVCGAIGLCSASSLHTGAAHA